MKTAEAGAERDENNSIENGWASLAELQFAGGNSENPDLLNEYLRKRDIGEMAVDRYRSDSDEFKRDFEARATGTEDFEDWSIMGEDGISKTEIDYEGEKIPVYNLSGHDFCFFVHDIAYRAGDDYHGASAARERSEEILEDPSKWMARAEIVNQQSSSVGLGGAYSGNISMSIVTDKMPNNFVAPSNNSVYYGFSDIGKRRIVAATGGDAQTGQGETSRVHGEVYGHHVRSIDRIEREATPSLYNEVVVDRYEDDSDKPMPPQFIFVPKYPTFNFEPSKLALKHAKHFGIPVVMLDVVSYIDQNK